VRRAAAALAGLLLLAGCGGEGIPRVVEVGEPVPEYRAQALGADSVSLADLQGKVVLLNVWATWCPPCREEIPALQELYERHSARGLEVVGVSIDAPGEEAAVRDFMRGQGVTYPVWLDSSDRVSSTFRLTGVPSTFLIGRDGTLLWKHLGPITAEDPGLTAALEEALGE
jgi:peroxiredoxin